MRAVINNRLFHLRHETHFFFLSFYGALEAVLLERLEPRKFVDNGILLYPENKERPKYHENVGDFSARIRLHFLNPLDNDDVDAPRRGLSRNEWCLMAGQVHQESHCTRFELT